MGKNKQTKKIPKASRDDKKEISDWKDAVLNVFLCRRAGKNGTEMLKRDLHLLVQIMSLWVLILMFYVLC